MTFSSVKYTALAQNDQEEEDMIEMKTMFDGQAVDIVQPGETVMQYGMPEGSFESAFTYARYNDLDRMGYEAPRRHGAAYGGNRYANFTYSRDFDNDDDKQVAPMNSVETAIYLVSLLFVVLTMPVSLFFSLRFVGTNEKLVVLRLGKAQRTRGPGISLVVPCIDKVHRVSTSITAFYVPPIQVITTDRGLVELGATVFLKIRDPVAAVCGVQDRNNSIRTLANTMMFRYVSKKRICEISNAQERRMLSGAFKDELGNFTAQFGVEITDVEMSEVKVIKEGENMGLAALNTVVKSDAGAKLWQVIGPTFEEIAKDFASEKKEEEKQKEEEDAWKPSGPLAPVAEQTVDVDHLITVANLAIDEHLTRLIGRVFQVNCEGLDPIYFDLKHPPGTAAKGTADRADVTFTTSPEIFSKIISKEISPMTAYMNGSLVIKGSIQDALSMKYLTERMADWL